MSLQRYTRFSLSGLLHATFVIAVFFAFWRVSPNYFTEGFYGAVAAWLVLGLWQQSRDILLALRDNQVEATLRHGAWWNVAWRLTLSLGITAAFFYEFAYRYVQAMKIPGDTFFHRSGETAFLDQPLPHSLLLASLIFLNAPAAAGGNLSGRLRLRRFVKDGLGLVLAGVWLAIVLSQTVVIVALVHIAIHGMDNARPLWLMEEATFDRIGGNDSSLLVSMAVSFAASCVGLACVRWLAGGWNAPSQRFVALGVFVAVAVLQTALLHWALGTLVPQMSGHLWENRPREVNANLILGVMLLLVGVTALAQRWTTSAVASPDEPALAWRKPGHYYPHEWALLLFVLPAANLWHDIYISWTYLGSKGFLTTRVFAEIYLTQSGSLLHLAMFLTAARLLDRWLRGHEVSLGSEIRPLHVGRGLTIWLCLLVSAVLTIPALGLVAFAGWIVLGKMPAAQ